MVGPVDSVTLYACLLWGAFVLLFFCRLFSHLVRFLFFRTTLFFLKHVVYPDLSYQLPIRRIDSLVAILYLTFSALAVSVGTRSSDDISRRAGLLLLVNLVPLFAGSNVVLTNSLGISLRAQTKLHAWIGIVSFCHGMVHSLPQLPGWKIAETKSSLGAWAVSVSRCQQNPADRPCG